MVLSATLLAPWARRLGGGGGLLFVKVSDPLFDAEELEVHQHPVKGLLVELERRTVVDIPTERELDVLPGD
jgi:hypothetical protein